MGILQGPQGSHAGVVKPRIDGQNVVAFREESPDEPQWRKEIYP
jgi:hypothetical protein